MKYIKYIKSILNKKEKIKIIYITLLMMVNTFFELLSVGMILPIINILLKKDLSFLPENIYNFTEQFAYIDLIKILIGFIILIYLIKNLFIIFYHYQQGLFLRNLQIRVVGDLFEKYIYQNYSFFLQKDLGTILRNVNTSRVVSLCILSYMTVFLEIIIVTCFLIYLLYLNFLSTIIISSIFLFFSSGLYLITKKKLYEWGSQKQEYDAKINQQIIQAFSLIKNIKIFNKEKKITDFLKKILFNYENLTLKTDIVQQLPRGMSEVLGIICISLLILILSIMGETSTEIVVLAAIYAAVAYRLIPSSTRIIAAAQRIKNYGPSLELVKNEFITTKNNISNYDTQNKKLRFNKIEFDNVDFHYNKNEKNIFSNISISINRGEVIGILGESGSGKSTFINLISGLIKPTKGKIKINSEDLENTKNNWLSCLGYVPQQVTLFNDTIANNISFFEEKKDNKFQENLESVIKKVNLKDFINSLPEKENTEVGENAAKLSGGQIQRIGISRALFNDPEFIIFDESTNSLDEQNEISIMDFIYSLKNSKTVLIISHKKSILEKCDKIYEVKDKKINLVK